MESKVVAELGQKLDSFLSWRAIEIKRYYDERMRYNQSLLTKIGLRKICVKFGLVKPPFFCSCITSVINPSWASRVHDIEFHVCEDHAGQFDIYSGPYWESDDKIALPF